MIMLERAQRVLHRLITEDPERARQIRDALFEDVVEEPETVCLLTPTRAPRKVRFDGVQMPAYRFVFCVDHGVALPWHQVVRHRCHNRLCINPRHFQQGDRRDNKHDDWTRAAYGLDLLGLRRG